ncbi:HlyD family type I secretion periplasmic adaptor subunit [Pseudomonas gingeri NCPPB 3146 = LMG 5327]|uniref:Membrane fusion protein (MFP) family protein n=2 Tax=Pseudomonas gingeri TaxID=117681 RepID=A0A7Y7YJ90_9PSED|nr:HlyD family type I secretion periplasmic adaptor subunit [Pseudomonas gingeri]NWA02806.1 HlyD family type I secretion periplasmic adaptor subunit [Pseudomonas gingeri]NWA18233.1 HlyD family type I secretion periplasmic adaptor subunit [Pseudomonas gingeri]NWA58977.1 HlyD family type I secretion periplasmic adaptor subunit [Pseudomonas gingeri]NWA99556.1 HlyD family type I secretion periplasmic adaptor subunit [Pseudomonas gingeri]NWB05561.1 HlyD family type I secretion periplasmic adaptor s
MSQPSAGRELFRRYRRIWKQAWGQRKLLDAPQRLPHEVQFLPAALALQDQPVHPAPRYIQWTIMLFALLALLWSIFGQIDVVATATGKIVASGKSKTIQPSEVAVVKSIQVHDGQVVKAGDVLVELDTSATGADIKRLKSDLLAAEVDSARATALIESIQTGKEPGSLAGHIPQAAPEQERAAQRWVQGQYLELRSSLEQIDAEIEQRSAEIQSTRATLASLQKTLPIARRLAEDYQQMLEQQYVPRHAYLEKQQALLDQERDMAVQQSRLAEVGASKKEAERRRAALLAQSRRTMLDLQQQSEQKAASLTQELNKAEQRDHLMSLTAPVDGTVQQLAVHTIGGVVTAAQPLMIIAPSDQPVEVEAMFENKDIGFVRPGQPVTVKVETFTFTKYGAVDGEVISVSKDAIEDEKRGPIYSSRIRLLKDKVTVQGQEVSLSPGMSVTAEAKTDKRRVIEYFLSPLEAYASSSLKER